MKEIVSTDTGYKNVCKADIMGMPFTKLTYLCEIDCDPLLWLKRLGYASLK